MGNVFVGRQPIHDRAMNIAGYELLYRKGPAERAVFTDGDRATCSVLSNTLDIGLKNVCGSHPAYVNCTRAFIEGRYPIPLDPTQMVIEVLETERVDKALVGSLRELKTLGFQIALDDFKLTAATRPLLEVASIIKLDVRALSVVEIAEHFAEFGGLPVKVLAEKVETRELLDRCLGAGFDLFQGFCLGMPQLIQGEQPLMARNTFDQLLANLRPAFVLA